MHPVATSVSPQVKHSQCPLRWQFVQLRDYSNAGHMLVATDFTVLLVNLESITSKPKAGGGSKCGVAWEVEKAVHYVVHSDLVSTDSSTD